ncbi:MerR family transcriptional regulator [Enterococcus xiangfangensis]|uniref:MerR family transcriptional regulator n=1 Tax=Enterococcus xiangfangensis TaxID=1296537 RepID=UPI0010F4724B|nr:MerR family transcriptional regulator [Enterococcus xiangfangensis]MBM7710664.1 DNA-binding transcriptional MerR regulator [Enterococcus xiangfangensis]
MKKFLIGDITKMYGISQDTLRYYDKAGLLPFVKKNQVGRRVFTEDDLGYIEVIDCLKRSGIPIKEIAKFMDWCVQGDKTLPQRYAFMVEQEVALEKKIQELQTQLDFLRWKKWYYKTANEAATEEIFFKEDTRQVDKKWRKKYLETIKPESI